MSNRSVTVGRVDGGFRRLMATPGRAWIVILVVFIAALSLRLVDIGGRSLWVDEGATAVISQLDIDQLLASEDADREHPPGYYTLIHLTSTVSDSEAGLRLPSALASALAAVVTYLVGRRLGGHQVGLLSAAIIALSPLDLWYAQEARQPVFAGLAVIGAIWGLTRRGWVGISVSAVAIFLGLYFDYITAVGWLAAGAIWMVMWFKSDRVRVVEWLGVTAAAGVAFAVVQGPEFVGGFRGLLGYDGAGVWYGVVLGSNPVTSNAFGLLLLAGIATAVLFAVGNRLTGSVKSGTAWTTLIVAGFAIGSALSPIPRAYSVKKVIVVGWPVLALVIGFLILHRLRPQWRRTAVAGVLALSLMASTVSFFIPKDDWRAATAHINRLAMSRDMVWVGPEPWAADAYLYYGGSLPVSLEAEPSAADLPANGEVWLITYRRPQDVAPSLAVEEWFDQNWLLVEEVPFYRLAIRRYAR
ncbi:MAG: glycosyltransferase family 39 protein [Acidimicrobiia bacterium]